MPSFLGGQSLGGLIASTAATRFAETTQIAGLVLASPAMDVEKGPILKVQAALAPALAAAMPWARLVPAVRTEDMSEDPAVHCHF